jgi:hypothetical protein
MSDFLRCAGGRSRTVAVLLAALAISYAVAAQSDDIRPTPSTLLVETPEEVAYLELPIRTLKQAVPSLRGIRYDADQEQLADILSRVARTIDNVLPRLPDLISREEVYHPQGSPEPVSAGGMAPEQPWSRRFNYLLLCHRNASAGITIEELRTDGRGRPADPQGLLSAVKGYGFAYQWLFFSSANQPEFRFRYLGWQVKNGRKTFVVAFAQDPHKVDDPAYFVSDGKTAPFYYQGVLWVDQSSFDIVALRTDLLAPLPAMMLRQLTTQLTFRSVPIRGYDAVFWLPSEVDISSDQGHGPSEESHRYSDYHLFHAEARVVSAP